MIVSLLLLINAEMPAYFGPIDFKISTGYLKREGNNSHVVALAKDFTAAKSYMDTLEETKSLKLNWDAGLKSLGIDGARHLKDQGWIFQYNGYRAFLAIVKNTWQEIENLKNKLQKFIDCCKSPLLKSAQPIAQKDIQMAELIQKEKESAKRIAELESQNAQKEAKLAEFERKLTLFENQIQEKSEEMRNSHEKCIKKDAQIKAVNQQLDAITARLNSEKLDRSKNEEKQKQLEQELNRLNAEKEALSSKKRSCELDNQSLCIQKENEINAVKQQLHAIALEKESDRIRNEAEKARLEKEIEKLGIEKKYLTNEKKELISKYDALKAQKNTLELEQQALQAEKKASEQESKALAKQLNPIIDELYTVKTQHEQLLNFWVALIDSTTAPHILEPKEVKTWGCLLKKIENWSENQTDLIKYEITNKQIHDLYWNCLESMAQIEHPHTHKAASRIFYASLPVKEQLNNHAIRVKYQKKLFAFYRQVLHLSTHGVVSAEEITTFDDLIDRIEKWKEYNKTIHIDASFIKRLYLKPKQDPYNGINQWLQGVNAANEPMEDDGVRSISSSVQTIPDSVSSYEVI